MPTSDALSFSEQIAYVAEQIASAKTILIAAGSGMDADSGVHDFRVEKNFLIAYPSYEQLGVNFIDILNPIHFQEDPELAWGFFGAQINFYAQVQPHPGFALIKKWVRRFKQDYFVISSNISNQFEVAHYARDKISEIHGNLMYFQCAAPCSHHIWKGETVFEIDESNMRAHTLPTCPKCLKVARPNMLLLHDFTWISQYANKQFKTFENFLLAHKEEQMLVLEIGVSSNLSTIRQILEKLSQEHLVQIIRINPTLLPLFSPHLSIGEGALKTLEAIDSALN